MQLARLYQEMLRTVEQSTRLKESIGRTELGYIVLWVCLNLLDVALTFINLNLGGVERNMLYSLTGSMGAFLTIKYCYVALVVIVLARYNRLTWLKWFVLGMVLVLAWNIKELLLFLY